MCCRPPVVASRCYSGVYSDTQSPFSLAASAGKDGVGHHRCGDGGRSPPTSGHDLEILLEKFERCSPVGSVFIYASATCQQKRLSMADALHKATQATLRDLRCCTELRMLSISYTGSATNSAGMKTGPAPLRKMKRDVDGTPPSKRLRTITEIHQPKSKMCKTKMPSSEEAPSRNSPCRIR